MWFAGHKHVTYTVSLPTLHLCNTIQINDAHNVYSVQVILFLIPLTLVTRFSSPLSGWKTNAPILRLHSWNQRRNVVDKMCTVTCNQNKCHNRSKGHNNANTENKQTEEAHQNLWVINYTGVMYQIKGMKHANYTYTLKLRGKS